MAWPQTGDIHVNLNMRTGAGTSNSIIRTIPKNSTVTVTGPPIKDASGNDWYPVSYGGVTGYSKASYFDPLKPTAATPTPVPTPGGTPTVPGQSTGTQSSPYYDPNSAYGGSNGSQADTKVVTDQATVGQERERWLTGQGFGGVRGIDRAAQSLAPRLDSGFEAAKLNNPGLKPRAYFDGLGKQFLRSALNRMTPGQRNESYATKNPFVRSTPR